MMAEIASAYSMINSLQSDKKDLDSVAKNRIHDMEVRSFSRKAVEKEKKSVSLKKRKIEIITTRTHTLHRSFNSTQIHAKKLGNRRIQTSNEFNLPESLSFLCVSFHFNFHFHSI